MPSEIRSSIDLRSDTVTRPSPEMLAAMIAAPVGDHVLGDDPTARELEEYAAELLGKEAALYFPSGIMANQTAILALADPGTEVLLDSEAHIVQYEEGAASAIGGVQLRGIESENGIPEPLAYASQLSGRSRFRPRVGLVCMENTHNAHGGRVVPLAIVRAMTEVARDEGIPTHLDGARLPNAATATGRPMKELAAGCDTVMVSLSKVLGAPVGSVLAGPAATMERAWRIRRRLGGGMRQAGLLAAAGLYALRNNFERLVDDHRRARSLAAGLGSLTGVLASTPETNIVMVDVDPAVGTASGVVERLRRLGVLASEFGPQRVRLVTHLDIDDSDVEFAIQTFATLVSNVS